MSGKKEPTVHKALSSVASGKGRNHGAVCFGVRNLSNSFQGQGTDMKKNLKALEEGWKEPGLVPALPLASAVTAQLT